MIHKLTHLEVINLETYLLTSSDSNHSSKLIVSIIIVAFTIKEKRHVSRKDRAVSRSNIQPSSEYFSAHTGYILILRIVRVYVELCGES